MEALAKDIRYRMNPFNGIESFISPYMYPFSGDGIHSMELKEKVREYEIKNIHIEGIHSMELKALSILTSIMKF